MPLKIVNPYLPTATAKPCRPDGAPIYEGTRAQKDGSPPPIAERNPADVFVCMANIPKSRRFKTKGNYVQGIPQKPEEWG